MTENLKLSLWDAFVFFLSGCVIMACVLIHLWACGVNVSERLNAIPAAALGVSAFIVPLVAGLLFEPVANIVMSVFSYTKSKCVKVANVSCPNPIIEIVKSGIPQEVSDNVVPYHWAKDYLSQENIETPYMAFLSKFGFYRNVGVLSLINSILIPCLYGLGQIQLVLLAVFILGTFLYLWRSHVFYGHLGDAMFRHYIILHARREKDAHSQFED